MRASLTLTLLLVACSDPPSEPAADTTAEPPSPELTLVGDDPSDDPIPGLEAAQQARFAIGDARFEMPFRESQGLGPLYIQHSCVSCHEDDARGPSVVRRLALIEGERDEVLPHGDVVRPRTIDGASPLMPPDAGVREEVRLGPPVFGRGYLEAVPDATLLRYEREQAQADDGVSGRAHRVEPDSAVALADWLPRLGRFGLKGRIASLDEFVADALQGDMGMTSPVRPNEPPNPDGRDDDAHAGVDVTLDEVQLIADYVRLLAMPARDPAQGAELFVMSGCATCHVPSVRTRADHPVEALRDQRVALFTDLLLHDMGEGLSDGITEGDASAREWRTPALMGLRFQRRLLHDGRAETVREAIDAHASAGSEANGAVERFGRLSEADQAMLVAYVEAL